jgi:hypothetical protein
MEIYLKSSLIKNNASLQNISAEQREEYCSDPLVEDWKEFLIEEQTL